MRESARRFSKTSGPVLPNAVGTRWFCDNTIPLVKSVRAIVAPQTIEMVFNGVVWLE